MYTGVEFKGGRVSFRILIRMLIVLALLLAVVVSSVSAATVAEAGSTNQPPTGVLLIEPDVNGMITDVNNPGGPLVYPNSNITFKWGPGSDPEGGAVTYRLEICTDGTFISPPPLCNIFSGITDTSYQLNYFDVGGTTYYWRVFTVDAAGNETPNIPDNPDVPRSFKPRTGSLPTILKVVVAGNDGTPGGIPLVGASVSLDGWLQVSTIEGGACLIWSDAGTHSVTVSADHYQTQTFPVTLVSGNTEVVHVLLEPDPSISVTILGDGSGTVSSSPADMGVPGDISCTKNGGSGCSARFAVNNSITLNTTKDWKSNDVIWGGDCNGVLTTFCLLSVDSPKSVTATFNHKLRARIGDLDYASLQDAYDSVADNGSGIINAITDYVFQENLTLGAIKTITIDGGYTDLAGSSTGGSTILDGTGGYTLAIKNGRLNVRGLKIR